MRTVRPHKITSVVHRLDLGPDVEIVDDVRSTSGQVLVVKALEEKRVYDLVELTTGRMAHVGKGDILVGALGRRDALRGFVGRVPEAIRVGDEIHLLNLGGVLGQAVSENRDVGHPLRVEVLGAAARNGRPLNIADAALAEPPSDTPVPPLVVVSGTCMNSGKTVAACEIIARLTQRGYAIGAAKLTGVAAVRDPFNMKDHGAVKTLTFHDCGYPSTAGLADVAPIAKRVLRSLPGAADEPLDAIVVEMGDGIIGRYGVDTILADAEFQAWIRVHVMAANDLVAAWGGAHWLRERGIDLHVVVGPATDNSVGMRYVENELGVAASNARTEADDFVDKVERVLFPERAAVR